MHGNLFLDNETIGHEFADGLARIRIGDFAGLIRIEPDLALATASNRCREALLSTEVDPVRKRRLADVRWTQRRGCGV